MGGGAAGVNHQGMMMLRWQGKSVIDRNMHAKAGWRGVGVVAAAGPKQARKVARFACCVYF